MKWLFNEPELKRWPIETMPLEEIIIRLTEVTHFDEVSPPDLAKRLIQEIIDLKKQLNENKKTQ